MLICGYNVSFAHGGNITGWKDKNSKHITEYNGNFYGYHKEQGAEHYHQLQWNEENKKWVIIAPAIYYDENFYKIEIDYDENSNKIEIVKKIIDKYDQDKILVIGQYINQLEEISKMLDCPIITGKTPNTERDKIYDDFRNGKIRVLVVSKVANFAIDLPDASLAIQVSGTFGSRQEEAQRLGRILRPKERTSRFFTLITRNTVEEEFGSNRQKFLAEQGYSYKIVRSSEEI